VAIVLVDDHVLGRILRGDRVRELARHDIATTGLWYLRLCQAVERGQRGQLSEPLFALPFELQGPARERIMELPNDIALVSLRTLAPVMARQLPDHDGLNLLAREVLAAATSLPAEVVVSAGNIGPRLTAALGATGRRIRVAR
jgi:hypothetical protein